MMNPMATSTSPNMIINAAPAEATPTIRNDISITNMVNNVRMIIIILPFDIFSFLIIASEKHAERE